MEEGYTTSCIVKRKEGESEGETLVRSHKSGVTYTDTAVSLTFMSAVESGDKVALDITVPTRCQVSSRVDAIMKTGCFVKFVSFAELEYLRDIQLRERSFRFATPTRNSIIFG